MHKILTFVKKYSKYTRGGWSLPSVFSSLSYFKQLALCAESRGLGVERKRSSRNRTAPPEECMSQKVAFEQRGSSGRLCGRASFLRCRNGGHNRGIWPKDPLPGGKDSGLLWHSSLGQGEAAICSDHKWLFIILEFGGGPWEDYIPKAWSLEMLGLKL